MATIKSYTDLSQSKKLAEILPLESADMHYEDCVDSFKIRCEPSPLGYEYNIPCWSLAALLEIIPKHIKGYNVFSIDIGDNDTSIWYYEVGCGVNNNLPNITMKYAIDACYEMIIKLHELKML